MASDTWKTGAVAALALAGVATAYLCYDRYKPSLKIRRKQKIVLNKPLGIIKGDGMFCELISVKQELPCATSYTFVNTYDNQQSLPITIGQKGSYGTEIICAAEIDAIPLAPRGTVPIVVTFTIDEMKYLTLKATIAATSYSKWFGPFEVDDPFFSFERITKPTPYTIGIMDCTNSKFIEVIPKGTSTPCMFSKTIGSVSEDSGDFSLQIGYVESPEAAVGDFRQICEATIPNVPKTLRGPHPALLTLKIDALSKVYAKIVIAENREMISKKFGPFQLIEKPGF